VERALAELEALRRSGRRIVTVQWGRSVEAVEGQRDRARRSLRARVEAAEADLAHSRARVAALSPAATLQRGYAVVQRADGAVVRAPSEVDPGDRLRVRLAHGDLGAVVSADP
jgi:exodeoxyribonuclease VII large subunit